MKNLILILIGILFISGCSHTPYTKGDKIALSAFLASQATDIYTTKRCLQENGKEYNPLLPSNPSDKDLILFKTVDTGIFLFLEELMPKHRKTIFGIGSIVRFSISYHNYEESEK